MKRVVSLVLLSLVLAVAPAIAADRGRVAELVEVMRVPQQMDLLRDRLRQTMHTSADREAQRRGLDAAARARLDRAMQAIDEELPGLMSWEVVRDPILDLYAETLDDAELDALLAYYRDPSGQPVPDKASALSERAMAIGHGQVEAAMPRLQARLRAAMDDAGSGGQ